MLDVAPMHHSVCTETNIPTVTNIRTIDAAEYSAWNQYARIRAGAGTYLSTAWKLAIERGYDQQTFYLAAFNQGTVVGILPLVLVKPPLARGSLVSLPYCDYGGLLADTSDVAAALLKREIELAEQLGTGLEIRSAEPNAMLEQHVRFAQVTG